MTRRHRHRVVTRPRHRAYRWRTWTGRVWPVFKSVLALGILAGLTAGARHVWVTSSWLRVTRVVVDGVEMEQRDLSIPLRAGDHLFGFSAGALARDVMERHPHLASVSVRRGWGGVVTLRAQARTARARLRQDGRWWGVDAEARLFPLADDGEGLVALKPDGDNVPGALAFLELLRHSGEGWTDRLDTITIGADGEAVVTLSGRMTVHWGEALSDAPRVAAQARRLGRVLDTSDAAYEEFEYARFIHERRVVLKPRPGVARESHGKTGTHHGA